MRKFEKFTALMQDALQRQFVSVAYFPARKYVRLRARTVLPERLGLESVFEIGIGTDQKYFVSSFYILNKHFDGKYGIMADAPCAVHRGDTVILWKNCRISKPH